MKHSRVKEYFLGTVFAALVAVGVPMPAQAGIVGTPQLLQQEQQALTVAQVQQWLSRADVRQQLETLGVNPEQASERVAALTDQELQQLNLEAPAGGDGILVVIGIVFVVLIILDLVGVTHVFRRI